MVRTLCYRHSHTLTHSHTCICTLLVSLIYSFPPFADLESFEIRSVLSESEKESLDVAMSMMALSEIQKLEDEARRIQNNVRGWLLRKNFVNLRDAAITLQGAW